ncbi:MAG: hypothetical protein LBL48_04795 [Azoarcus sp.]|jgi:hypothetical protein|nr:hypothetical protein [Azoarcus sp.]
MTPAELARLAAMPAFPETARELIGVVGIHAAARLIREWPGQEFPVPAIVGGGNAAGVRRWEHLCEVVGADAAGQIVRHYGVARLYIPNLKRAKAQWGHDFARHEYDRLTKRDCGYSHDDAIREIALKIEVAYRTVERWLDKPDHALPLARQAELF